MFPKLYNFFTPRGIFFCLLSCCLFLVLTSFNIDDLSNNEIETYSDDDCDLTLTVENKGDCPLYLYEWLSTGDVFETIIQAGDSYSVETEEDAMWRVTNGDFNNLVYDENIIATFCPEETWVTYPVYCNPPMTSWNFDCESEEKVEIVGEGIINDVPHTLTFANSSNIYKTVVEVVYKGGNPGPQIVVFDNDGNPFSAYREEVPGSSSNVWVYRATMPGSASASIYNTTNQNKAQSMVAYLFRENVASSEQSGVFTYLSGHNNIETLTFDIPAATETRDIKVAVPISELTDDGRYLLLKASAGGVNTQQFVYGPSSTLGCCLDILELTLNDVPAGATQVTLEIDTRHNQNGQTVNGQSYVLAGAVEVTGECIDVCEVELTINNNGECHLEIYEWLPTGDVYIADLEAGQSYTVTTHEGAMWRVNNGDWNNLVFDESYTVNGCNNQTWNLNPTYCDPCINLGGDSDNDGVCDNDDCQPNNPNVPATVGSSCDDNNPCTDNDVYVTECNCEGTLKEPKLTIVNNGNCPVELYHWVPTGDIYTTNINANGSYTVDTYDGAMWRVKYGNWGSLVFDESYTVTGCNDQTWTVTADYCVPSNCTITSPGSINLTCLDDTSPNFTGYPTIDCDNGGTCQRAAGYHELDYQIFDNSTTIDWSFGQGWQIGGGCTPSCGLAPNAFIDFTNMYYNYDRRLTSPVFDACCMDYVQIDYCIRSDLYTSEGAPTQYLDVQYKIGNGNWETLNTYESVNGQTNDFNEDDVIIPGAAGNTLRIRFRVRGPGGNFTLGGWGVDRLRVEGNSSGCSAPISANDFNITYDDASSGTCPEVITRTWTATPIVNTGTGVLTTTQTISIIDQTAPDVMNVPANVTIECDQTAPINPPSFMDACDNDLDIVFAENIQAGLCDDNTTLVRTWTATDDCGNARTATQLVTRIDTTNPVLQAAPANMAAECDEVPAPANLTATDNCDNNVLVTFNENRINGTCDDNYTLERIWIATDNCGNTVQETQTINVADQTPPVFANLPDVTLECSDNLTPPNPVVSDNCDIDVTVILNDEFRTNLSCTDNYTLTRVWTATDNCGNQSTYTQVATIEDTTNPSISAPADDTVLCDDVPAPATVGANDNCDNDVTVTFAEVRTDGNCPNNYILTRTWTATDNCGNTSSDSQVLTVIDATGPEILDIPASMTVECDAFQPAPTLQINDNCDANATITLSEEMQLGVCTDNYTVIRTWTATDACGNITTAIQVVTVTDTTSPELAGIPADATVECSAIPAPASPTASDNCDNDVLIEFAEQTIQTSNGSCTDNSYTITRIWKATDNCGNVDIQQQVITVEDTTDPILIGVPVNETVECDAVPNPATPTATDNCDDDVTIDFVEVRTDGSCDDTYTLTRTWTAIDNCGNADVQVQIITIQDTTDPELIGVPGNVTVECDLVPAPATPEAIDNCDDDVTIDFVEVRTDGSCDDTYTLTRTWTATDNCGRTDIQVQVIQVQDTTDPNIYDIP
ncbi:MAG: hypothetical protein AB8F94_14530, partial [Saprospiraceae bacterium]